MAPLTNAERQKRFREKLKQNPEKHEENKKKHREYMKIKRKPTAEVSAEEKQKRRAQWQAANEIRKRKRKNIQEEIKPNVNENVQMKKKVKVLENYVDILEKTCTKLKKQVYRQKRRIMELTKLIRVINNNPSLATSRPKIIDLNPVELTPMSSAEMFVQEYVHAVATPDKQKVKKKILELNVLNKSLQDVYHKTKDNSTKKVLKKIATHDLVKKYKMKGNIKKYLGLTGTVRKQPKKCFKYYKEAEDIRNFFIRDDNSRMTAGKKEFVGRGENKKQKRFLLASMKRLYTKYTQEGGKVSYSTFRRNRPRFVVRPKLTDRDTCACIRHSNLLFKSQKLKKIGVLDTCDLEELLQTTVCDVKSYSCMYSKCEMCKTRSPKINVDMDFAKNTECSWLHWTRKEHTYQKQDANGVTKTFTSKKYAKDVADGSIAKLIEQFISEMQAFRKHYYNIQHQHLKYREVVDDIQENEAGILIDFSENYACKMATEIQSLHFGASKSQITLHTGILYLKTGKQCFASISQCNDHNPGAIWAHLEPIFELINREHPNIDTVHLFSDGPSTQYKQKKNFYQMTQILQNHGMAYGTWSFFEAAHGKGAADGVGGALKRLLDQHVAFGTDVFSATDAFDVLTKYSSVKIFYVTEADIREKQKLIPDNLVPTPRTMDLHQIIVNNNILRYRDVSCFCGRLRGLCYCFNAKVHNLQKKDANPRNIKTVDQVPTNQIQNSTTNLKNPPKRNKLNKPQPKNITINSKKIKPSTRKRSISEDSTTTTCSDITYEEEDASPYQIEEIDADIDQETWYDPDVPSTSSAVPLVYRSNYITPMKKQSTITDPPHKGSAIKVLANEVFNLKDCLRKKFASDEANDKANDEANYEANDDDMLPKYNAESWVIVQYDVGNKTFFAVGQILECSFNRTYQISFLQKIKRNKFTWSDTESEECLESQIIKILPIDSVFENEQGELFIQQLPKLKYE